MNVGMGSDPIDVNANNCVLEGFCIGADDRWATRMYGMRPNGLIVVF